MDNLIGKQIGQYRIDVLLGEGGMGAVYRALDVSLDRPVALKIMHSQYADQPQFQQRFAQEARAIARLNHTSIVTIYQFSAQAGLLYIAMEYVPGNTLEAYFHQSQQEKRRIDLSEIITLLAQVADALDYAHRQGIIHRDIKPSNILIRPLEKPDRPGDPPLRAVVTDFGLVKLMTGGMETQTGTFMGSLPYMSPEQTLGQELDSRSDIYSLGVVLYQLTTGQFPYDIRTPTDAVLKHMKEVPPPPRQFNAQLPAAIETIILKALAKDLNARYPSAGEMATALRNAAGELTQDQVTEYAPPGASISMATQFQASAEQPRGASILKDFSPAAALGQDQIQVLYHGKTILSLPIKSSITIGRDAGNDIRLDDAQISRQHARIEYDGKNITITDLKSANGTFLGDAQLLAGVPEAWTPEKAARIGNHWLRLVKASQQARNAAPAAAVPPTGRQPRPTTATAYDSGQAAPRNAPPQAAQPLVGIALENDQLFVEPGGSVALKVTVMNQSERVDHYRVTVKGLPAEWLPSIPPPVQALPGDAREVTLIFRPPRSPSSRAGEHPFKVYAASVADPNQIGQASAVLIISSYSQFRSELHPARFQSGRASRVTVHNQGNQPETFTLSWRDPGEELIFTPALVQLKVPEGRSAAAEFRASPRQLHWIGKERQYTFTAETGAPGGDSQAHSGEFISRARIPIWAFLGALALCLLLTTGGVLAAIFSPILFGSTPTQGQAQLPTEARPVVDSPTPGIVENTPSLPTITSAPTQPPTITPSPIPTVFIGDFAGEWKTNFAAIHLAQDQAQVNGKYSWYGSTREIDIQGTVDGDTLNGSVGITGNPIVFVLSADGLSFDGFWENDNQRYQWCGVRTGSLPPGCGFSGHWNTISDYTPDAPPTADLIQTGDHLEGTFFNGRSEGTVIGTLGDSGSGSHYTVTGSYTVDGFTSQFRWTLVGFNSLQFQGIWVNDQGEHPWCGWRDGFDTPDPCSDTH